MKYVLNRLKEGSTWRGVLMVLTAVGVNINPELQEAIITAGLGLAGLLGVFFPDAAKEETK